MNRTEDLPQHLQLDVYGHCPDSNCNCNWDGGDIRHNLSMLSVMQGRQNKDIDEIAAHYGYEPGKSFTRVIIHQTEGVTLYECPKCRNVFDVNKNKYFSVQKALDDINNNQPEPDIQ